MLVVMGSRDSSTDRSLPWLDDESRFVAAAIARGVPVMGICFGAQLLAGLTGGRVLPGAAMERGMVDVSSEQVDRVPAGPWYAHHRDEIVPPPEADVIATSAASVQAFGYGPHLGVQFHPEATEATLDVWRTSFSATAGAPTDDDAEWEADRRALQEHRIALAARTGTLVRGFVRSAQRHLADVG
ncbi:type 1 glutamine amidotransferase [Raineyella fluvialis]|nr:gamma-glutamyl-gamma-aminobutyrate hydrolase family protein [Raineyella fluvialis]